MERIVCVVIGYVFGLLQSGYLYGRTKNMDIRQYGSGNAGSTNVLRVMGKKAGLIVFCRLRRDIRPQFPLLSGL